MLTKCLISAGQKVMYILAGTVILLGSSLGFKKTGRVENGRIGNSG
jgi:hypothetical protein